MNKEEHNQVIKFMDKLAKSPESIKYKQEKDQQTKELINEFVNNCYDYFATLHSERHVFPFIKSNVLDKRIISLLELYENNLAYLMRNPDCKFETAGVINIAKEDSVQTGIILAINKTLQLENESIKSVNNFIENLLFVWKKFKQHKKEINNG